MSINNRPLDGEPLVEPTKDLLGGTKLIGTQQFIAFLESLKDTVNTNIIVVTATTENAAQLSVSIGRLSANMPRQIEDAFSRIRSDPGLPARLNKQVADLQSSIGQQLAHFEMALGALRAAQQDINGRVAQVEALCQSNLVR